jgi:CRP/FNR family transcriptional regulator, cyclic AMP receptor protein
MKTTNTNDPVTAPFGSFERPENASKPTVEAAVTAHPFFKGMSPHHRRLLSDCAMVSHFEPGEFLINEGDVANRFYLIIQGTVALQSRSKDQRIVPIQSIGEGNVLGWSWLFPPYFWHFDAQATEPTDVLFLYATPLREECESDHDFGYEMIKRMTEVIINRLQATRRQLIGLQKKHGDTIVKTD